MFISSPEMVYADDVEFCRVHLCGIKFLFGGVSAGVNEGRKLNSEAHVDLCLFCSAVWVQMVFYCHSCLCFCMLEEGDFENIAASNLRCESDSPFCDALHL